MAWLETGYSKHTHFRWKIKWRLEHLGALGSMGKTVISELLTLTPNTKVPIKISNKIPRVIRKFKVMTKQKITWPARFSCELDGTEWYSASSHTWMFTCIWQHLHRKEFLRLTKRCHLLRSCLLNNCSILKPLPVEVACLMPRIKLYSFPGNH